MSHQRIRHYALVLVLGLIPLLPATPVEATAVPKHIPAQLKPLSAARIAQIRDSGPPVMREAADYVATAPPTRFTNVAVQPTAAQTASSNPRLYREVFGFAFAQSIGDSTVGYPSWNMSLLSTVAYFGVHVDWTGGLVNDSGLQIWDNGNGPVPGLISTAHANGTKVVLTIIMGDSTSGTPNMCSALDRENVTIQQTVAEVKAKGVDGVNIDYESNNTTCNDPGFPQQSSQSLFTRFVADMRAALPAGSYLSVDTYSGSAGFRNGSTYLGFFDIGALSSYVDSFFVMAYDMEYSNFDSPPLNCPYFCISPTAPVTTYLFNDSRASAEYTAVVSPSQVIMGIPYYGRKECVAGFPPSTAPPNAEGINVAADGYLDASTENGYFANSDYHIHREVRDTQGNTRWDTWTSSTSNCTREMYWDDATALGNKYDLVINNHLRGIGIFALSYGGGAPELWSLINLKFGQCSQAALSADHMSPQIPGTTVTFTGSALCAGIGTYRFWSQVPGAAGFTQAQAYSTSPTLTWDTTGKALGTYTFQVDARNQGAAASVDTYARMSFRLGVCAAPTLTSDAASPQLPGATVTFTAAATCQGSPQYQFWLLAPGAHAWQVVQPYSSTPTFSWNTTGILSGTYLYTVWVRQAGGQGGQCSSLGCSDAYFPATPFTLTNQPCNSVTDTPAPGSAQPSGTAIKFTAASSGCPHPLYQFWLLAPGAGAWQIVQPYSSTATFMWNTIGVPAGNFMYTVWARDASSPGTTCGALGCSDGYAPATLYSLTKTPCTSVTDVAAPASSQPSGTTITFTAGASACTHPLYQFWVLAPGSHTWQVVQPYSTAATFTWNTIGVPAGSYLYTVWARDSGSTGAACGGLGCQDAYAPAAAFNLTTQPCTSVTDSAAPGTPQLSGTTVTFTASASGCPHPLYQFWILAPGSAAWQVVKTYSTGATFAWNTTGAGKGNYLYTVWARDSGSGGTACGSLGCEDTYFPATTFALTTQPCASVTDSASPGSPQASGTSITFTAVAGGCPHPLYQFWILAPGSHTWQVAQAYSSTATFTWNTTGLPAGGYTYTVWARDASSSGTSCGSLGCYDTYFAATGYGLT